MKKIQSTMKKVIKTKDHLKTDFVKMVKNQYLHNTTETHQSEIPILAYVRLQIEKKIQSTMKEVQSTMNKVIKTKDHLKTDFVKMVKNQYLHNTTDTHQSEIPISAYVCLQIEKKIQSTMKNVQSTMEEVIKIKDHLKTDKIPRM